MRLRIREPKGEPDEPSRNLALGCVEVNPDERIYPESGAIRERYRGEG